MPTPPPLCRASPAPHLPSISSWKRSRWPHDLLFEEGPVDTQKQAKHNPITPQGATPAFAELRLSDILFLFGALVKIHLHVYGQPGTRINRCFMRFKLLLCSTVTRSMIMSMTSSATVHPAEETIAGWILCVHSFVKNQVQLDLPGLRRPGRS